MGRKIRRLAPTLVLVAIAGSVFGQVPLGNQQAPAYWILGVQGEDTSVQGGSGFLINSVTPGGPAEKGGLEAGDTIVAVDGRPTSTIKSLFDALDDSNGTVSLTVIDVKGTGLVTTNPIRLIMKAPKPRAQGQAKQGCFIPKVAQGGIQPGNYWRWSDDQQLNNVVNETAKLLASLFGVSPRFYFFGDFESPNAFSTPEVIGDPNDFPAEFDRYGTVLLGLALTSKQLKQSTYSVPAVLAHEWAHTMQFMKGCKLGGKWRELHADFMAGWYIRHVKKTRDPNLDESAVFAGFYKDGGDQGFTKLSDHGTHRERSDAFLDGFGTDTDLVDDAYTAALKNISAKGGKSMRTVSATEIHAFQSPYNAPQDGKEEVKGHWVLGVTLQPVEVDGGIGFQVTSVTPGLPAQAGGFEPGDIILAINDHEVTDRNTLIKALDKSNGVAKMTLIDVNTGSRLVTPPIKLVDRAAGKTAPRRPEGTNPQGSETDDATPSGSTPGATESPKTEQTSPPEDKPTPNPSASDSIPPRGRQPRGGSQQPPSTLPSMTSFPPHVVPPTGTYPPRVMFPPHGTFPSQGTFPPHVVPPMGTYPPRVTIPPHRAFPPNSQVIPQWPVPHGGQPLGTVPRRGSFPQHAPLTRPMLPSGPDPSQIY